MDQTGYWMWARRKLSSSSSSSTGGGVHLNHHRHHHQLTSNINYDSWEEQAFAEDASGVLGGCVWPPRSYSCSFCRREFRSAQALGGHMNVHRRDRARLKQSSSPTSMNQAADQDQIASNNDSNNNCNHHHLPAAHPYYSPLSPPPPHNMIYSPLLRNPNPNPNPNLNMNNDVPADAGAGSVSLSSPSNQEEKSREKAVAGLQLLVSSASNKTVQQINLGSHFLFSTSQNCSRSTRQSPSTTTSTILKLGGEDLRRISRESTCSRKRQRFSTTEEEHVQEDDDDDDDNKRINHCNYKRQRDASHEDDEGGVNFVSLVDPKYSLGLSSTNDHPDPDAAAGEILDLELRLGNRSSSIL